MKNYSIDNIKKTILLTGANGFFGGIVQKVLNKDNLITLGLKDCDINVDMTVSVPELSEKIDMVIHAAGKAHIEPRSEKEKKQFFDVNVNGTRNLLLALDKSNILPNTFVFISSVSVYGLDSGVNLNENTPIKGNNAYAKSKIEAEELILEWGAKKGANVVILRLPLMVGDSAPGNLGSMYKAIHRGYYFRIKSGKVRRSMVLAEDVAAFIPKLYGRSGVFHLTDGYHPAYYELENAIAASFGKKIYHIPVFFAKLAAIVGDVLRFIPINSKKYEKLSMSLTFNDDKVRKELGWNSRSVLTHFNNNKPQI